MLLYSKRRKHAEHDWKHERVRPPPCLRQGRKRPPPRREAQQEEAGPQGGGLHPRHSRSGRGRLAYRWGFEPPAQGQEEDSLEKARCPEFSIDIRY